MSELVTIRTGSLIFEITAAMAWPSAVEGIEINCAESEGTKRKFGTRYLQERDFDFERMFGAVGERRRLRVCGNAATSRAGEFGIDFG